MGFLSSLGKGVGGVAKGVVDKVQEAKTLADEWSHKDKAFIHNKYKNGTAVERMAAGKVAKDNGWKS